MAKREARPQALFSIRARWAFFFLFGQLAMLAAWTLLGASWSTMAGAAWAALSSLVFATQLFLLWFDLPKNVPVRGGKLLPRFGPGTWFSLLRILALSMLAGFLWSPRPEGWLAWLPFALYLFYCLADLADGYAARAAGMMTRLGEKLDLDLDGRGLLVATLLAIHYGTVAWWFVLIGLARYLFVFAAWVHKQAGGSFRLRPSSLRRPLAGAQMGFGVAFLAPGLPAEVTSFVSSLTMLPFLGNFLVDWFTGAGWLGFDNRLGRHQLWQAASNWVLLCVRVALLSLLVWRFSAARLDLYSVFDIFLGFVLVLGLSGRLAAFALLVETGFRLQGRAMQAQDYVILFGGMILLYLGTGAISLRGMKEGWIFRRWGAKGQA